MIDMDLWLKEREEGKQARYVGTDNLTTFMPPSTGTPLPGLPCAGDSVEAKDYPSFTELVFQNVNLTPAQPDMVNHPPHYTRTKLETLDVIEDMVQGWDARVAYLLGNVVKYVWRHADKAPVESLKKARFYLDRAIDYLEQEK